MNSNSFWEINIFKWKNYLLPRFLKVIWLKTIWKIYNRYHLTRRKKWKKVLVEILAWIKAHLLQKETLVFLKKQLGHISPLQNLLRIYKIIIPKVSLQQRKITKLLLRMDQLATRRSWMSSYKETISGYRDKLWIRIK